jgi:FkbM family methyltransferase
MTHTSRYRALFKACFRSLVDSLLRLHGTKLPAYFNLRDRLSYLLHGLEPSLVKVAAGILRPGDTAIDIGANVGFLTRQFASLVGKQGKVLAFEPDPATFEFLLYNTQRLPQVSAYQEAVSDRIGKMSLHLHPTSGMSNSLVNAWHDARTIQVSTSTLDSWANDKRFGNIRLIKIDVEGAELLVLRGMQAIMKAQEYPHILFEFCPKNLGGKNVEHELFDLFADCGYALSLIDSSGNLRRIYDPGEVHAHLNKNDYANLLGQRD